VIASPQAVIKAVAETLKNQVLPELEAATWTASHVRACVMLLTYIEDRLTLEPPLLIEDNSALRALLAEAAAEAYTPLLGRDLREEITAALDELPVAAAGCVNANPFEGNLVYKELLTKAINRAFQNRAADTARYTELRTRIDACLAVLLQHENQIVKRAEKLDSC
jgi:hypothetical protein